MKDGQMRAARVVLNLMQRIEAEYREMPGLSVTLAQAGRLWSADHRLCAYVLTRLIRRGTLRETGSGRFVRV